MDAYKIFGEIVASNARSAECLLVDEFTPINAYEHDVRWGDLNRELCIITGPGVSIAGLLEIGSDDGIKLEGASPALLKFHPVVPMPESIASAVFFQALYPALDEPYIYQLFVRDGALK